MFIMFQWLPCSSNGSCWRLNNLAKKTDVPGKFTYTSERECIRTHTHTYAHIEACMQHSQLIHPKRFCCHMICSGLLPPSGWGNENDLRMVDVKYDEYALTHTIKTKAGVATVVNKLYGNVIVTNVRERPESQYVQYSHAD